MFKILILGSTGMLGNAVAEWFSDTGHQIVTTYRTGGLVPIENSLYFDALAMDFSALPKDFDNIINCIGIIKPFMADNPVSAIKVNALFPWELSSWCARTGAKLIHITTDCVFSGNRGKYIESDLHDALDNYGKSKSLGECTNAMVLRTSIIGEEIHKHASLIAWAKSQKGKPVDGYSTHLWNGITTKEYARCCHQIIDENLFAEGLFHIHAKDDVSKFEMLHYFNDKFELDLIIKEAYPLPVDRTLRSEKGLCRKLNIPTVSQMVTEI